MRIVYKIVSPVFAFLLAATIFFVIYSQRGLEQTLIRETHLRITHTVTTQVRQRLSDYDILEPATETAKQNFADLASSVAEASVARFTIWGADSTILYSNLQSIIGYNGGPRPEVDRALETQRAFYQVKERDDSRPVQTNIGRFIDIYIPVQVGSQYAVVEVHAVANAVLAPLQSQARATIIALIIGGAAITVVLFGIVRVFVSRPLNTLSNAFRAFSYGDLNYSVAPQWKDEIGLLTKNVDAMRQNLQYTIKELKTERDVSSAIISSTAEGIIVVDKNYSITLMNKAGEELFGFAKKDYFSKKINKVFEVIKDGKPLPLAQWAITRAFKTGKTTLYSFEDNIRYRTYQGKEFPAIAAVAPLVQKGKGNGAVVVFRDISEDRRLDEAKVNFISVASHQLRTPLASMRWFSEMLLHGDAGKLQDQQTHFIDRVYQGVIRMIGLVNLLLQTARVEAGRVTIEPTAIDLKSFTDEVIASLKVDFDAKKQTVEVTIPDESLKPITMDRDVLWQVVMNLLTNAGRYSPRDSKIGITITDKGTSYEYAVKDSGIGIPEEEKKHIFDKFYRAQNALKAVPEGSGLGLSLVKTLVTDWGGKVWFDSEQNKGTTFYFSIPKRGQKARKGEVTLVV